uniref:ABC transporter substrate-binding protein n=1 Tax=Nitratidesulfovibrio vulgaris (strain DSM 19637 / Miyazaki F) TaxID=883 RepID=B8DLD2_NITV9
MVRRFRFILLLAALLSAMLAGGAAFSQAASPRTALTRVCVVQSYHSGYIWCHNINDGIRDALRDAGVVIEVFYLDAKRNPSPDSLRAAARSIAARIAELAPRVVITVDDAAQLYLAVPYLMGKGGDAGSGSPQVVFCGVNAPLGSYGYPASDVTGVRERWHFREGFDLLRKIDPRIRSVAVLLDDSESAGYVLADMRDDMARNGPFALQLSDVAMLHTFQEWKRAVLSAQEHADALALGLYHSLVDAATGKTVPAETVRDWNLSVLRKPTLGFSDAMRDHGHLCGILESAHEQGLLAGRMARHLVLRGGRAGELPVAINQQGLVFVNLKTAERLGLVIPYEIIKAADLVIQ